MATSSRLPPIRVVSLGGYGKSDPCPLASPGPTSDNVVNRTIGRRSAIVNTYLVLALQSAYYAQMSTETTLSSGGSEDLSRPTMRDVAALARVGLKTVSRVINSEPGVSPELRARVQHAINQLDYLPNLTASSLRRSSGRSATIGLILENVANPFSSGLHRAIGDVAWARGVQVFSGSVDEDAIRERLLVSTFAGRRVDGLVVVPASHDHSYLLSHKQAGIAIVFVDRPAEFLDVDAIVSDNRGGSEDAVRHLLAVGHRRIAYLGDLATVYTARERHAGYVRGLGSAGIAADPAIVRHDLQDSEAAEAAVAELLALPAPPTALFTSQNLVTIGAVRALRAARAQREVALVGFDDVLLADMLEPAITVVAQDPRAIGTLAAQILFLRMDGDAAPTALHVVPTRLIKRGSGEIARPAA